MPTLLYNSSGHILSESQHVAPVTIDPAWTRLRVGVRLAMASATPTIANAPVPRLALGLCRGVDNAFGSPLTDHWVGAVTNAGIWAKRGAADRYDVNMSVIGAVVPAKRVGDLLSTRVAPTQMQISAVPSARRTYFFVDIVKGAPQYKFTILTCTDIPLGTADLSQSDFLAKMLVLRPAIVNHMQTILFGLNVDETVDGLVDSVNVSWNRNVPITIHDLAVADLS